MTPSRIASVIATFAMTGGAIAVGGGLPPSPLVLAREAGRAVDNVERAVRNITEAERDTRALASIADDVGAQVDASERLLETQLDIEESSRTSVRLSTTVVARIRAVERALDRVAHRLAIVSRSTRATGDQARAAAVAGRSLQATLTELELRFGRLVVQSRKLNRKARAYDEIKDGIP